MSMGLSMRVSFRKFSTSLHEEEEEMSRDLSVEIS